MSETGKRDPFGQRLHELLEQHGMSQSKLAERAGVERSTISRLIKADRTPTMDTLQCLAPVFGLDVSQLVHGTDADGRLTEAATMVRRQDYDAVVQKMVEFETKSGDLERKLRSVEEAVAQGQNDRTQAHVQLCTMQFKLETAERDVALERQRNTELSQELKRYRDALQRAVADVSSLRGQMEEVAREMKDSAKSNRTTAILAGVAALAGVVTVATYLASEETKKQTSDE